MEKLDCGGVAILSSGGREEGAVVVGVQRGTTGDERDQAGVLDVGSRNVWPRPEEVPYVTPLCKRVYLG